MKACLIPYWINYRLYCDILDDFTAKHTSQLQEITNGPVECVQLSDFAQKCLFILKDRAQVHRSSNVPARAPAFTFLDVETPIISPGEGIPILQETLEVRVAVLAFYRIFSCFQVKFDTHSRKPR